MSSAPLKAALEGRTRAPACEQRAEARSGWRVTCRRPRPPGRPSRGLWCGDSGSDHTAYFAACGYVAEPAEVVSSLDLSVCVLVREGARRRGEETEGGGGRSRNSSAAAAEEEDRRRRSGEAETRPGRGDSGRPPRAGQCEKQRAGDAVAAAAPPTSAPCVASLPGAAPQVFSPERKQN